jgi:hypothetical protein
VNVPTKKQLDATVNRLVKEAHAKTGTVTRSETLPDKRTTRFTLPNGQTYESRSVRSPGVLCKLIDTAFQELSVYERHILKDLLDLLPS